MNTMKKKETTKMSTVNITFSLPDEQSEHNAAMDGMKNWIVLWEISQKIRNILRYEDPPLVVSEELEKIQSYIHDNVDFDRVQ